MNTNFLDQSRQNQKIYLVTLETKTDKEHLVVIVPSRYAFSNWLEKQGDKYTDPDADCDYNLYNKHTYKNGDTIRLTSYQLSDYEPIE